MAWSYISPNARAYVNDVLWSEWLSRKNYIPRFEEAVARLHGAKHGILVSSGTDALRISWSVLKEIYKWPNDAKVIIPALTFVATANAVLQSGLVPVFADVEYKSGNIDPLHLAGLVTSSTVAVCAVHLFGLPANMPAVTKLCKQKNLKLIEDSCETFGVHRLEGDVACFSFYVSHHVSTGVGGMILTNNDEYARYARSYMNHGRVDDGRCFEFARSGYSSRITEMEAALGIGALEHFNDDLDKRRGLAQEYDRLLIDLGAKINLPRHRITDSSWMFFPVLLLTGNRMKLMYHLWKAGIESRQAMPLIDQPFFRDLYKKGSCPNAELWTNNGLLLPLHPLMDLKHVALVTEAIKDFYK